MQGQISRVCMAISTYFPSGYTSGISFLVAPLVIYMSEEVCFHIFPSEAQDAFWTFIAMTKREEGSVLNMEDIILWRRLEQVVTIWDKLLLLKSSVAHSLNTHGVSSSMYLFVLFPLQFSYQLPLDILSRLWDVILFEGTDALFFLGVNYMKELQSKYCTECTHEQN